MFLKGKVAEKEVMKEVGEELETLMKNPWRRALVAMRGQFSGEKK